MKAMRFRFANVLRKYFKPYIFIRPNEGNYDALGDWKLTDPTPITRHGHFQPVDTDLQQDEGGQYTEDDRTLYTFSAHQTGDLIEYQGIQYTVDKEKPRDYTDYNQYIVKKVNANDPIQRDSGGVGGEASGTFAVESN